MSNKSGVFMHSGRFVIPDLSWSAVRSTHPSVFSFSWTMIFMNCSTVISHALSSPALTPAASSIISCNSSIVAFSPIISVTSRRLSKFKVPDSSLSYNSNASWSRSGGSVSPCPGTTTRQMTWGNVPDVMSVGHLWPVAHPLRPENFHKLLFVDCAAVLFVVVGHELLHFVLAWLESERAQRNVQVSLIDFPCKHKRSTVSLRSFQPGAKTRCGPEPSVSRISNASSISFRCCSVRVSRGGILDFFDRVFFLPGAAVAISPGGRLKAFETTASFAALRAVMDRSLSKFVNFQTSQSPK